MSLITDLQAALLDAFGTTQGSFIWNGQTYGCIPNLERGNLVTSKALFGIYGYPNQGDKITVSNRDFQVTKVANDTYELEAGGIVQDGPFFDDPANPSLAIFFEPFIRK